MPIVTVYTTPTCPYCSRAKSLLSGKGVQYKEVDVSQNAAEREALVTKAGGRRTVPQIFIGETHVGGFDDLSALDKAGKLDGMLAA